MTIHRVPTWVLLVTGLSVACNGGGASTATSGGAVARGGTPTGGTAAASGGSARTGGSGSGGSGTASGGNVVATGGSRAGGSASGGNASGGKTGSGGAVVGSGGSQASGGTVAPDGGTPDPDASTGGQVATGGTPLSVVACGGNTGSGNATTLSLNGADIKSDNVNGLTFKGFGVLSANGTSALLMDYKAEHPEKYVEMLKILFGGTHPIMTQVKIEMGNDRNNSTGPDPATMRLENEAVNVARAPGFQLAADAKKLNPNLKVSILRWNAPKWANSDDKIYTWYKNTILAAYRTYGYMVDYVNPGVNEQGPNFTWTKTYASRVKADTAGFADADERAAYNAIQVVISDEAGLGSFGGAMVSDSALRSAVAVAGYHYNTDDDSAGNFKKLAEQYDKEIWNSEAQATFSNTAFRPTSGSGIGGINGPLEMGNTIIKGFVKSRRTHFIYQPAIGSFYEGGQYSFKELLSARDPWSGWIHYDAGLDVLRHFSWFAKTGWENAGNSAGIWRVVPSASATGATGTNPIDGRNGTPSYLTLASPDKKDFSMILMNDSNKTQVYTIQPKGMAYTGQPALELWESRAADNGKAFNSNYLKYLCTLAANTGGAYTVVVKPFSVITATTLANTKTPELQAPLPVEGPRAVLDTDATGAGTKTTDKVLYADDFDYSARTVPVLGDGGKITGTESYIESRGGDQSVMPRFTSDRNGGFEAFLPDGSTNYVLRQQLDQSSMGLGGTWNNGDPVTGIGDNRWLNYRVSVDVSFERNNTQNGGNYAALGARQQGGGNSHTLGGTPYVLKYVFDGGWQLLVDGKAVSSGNVVGGTGGVTIPGFKAAFDEWHTLSLEVVDKKVTAFLDGTQLASYTDAAPRLSGRVDLASGYYFTRFDNLKVETVDGAPPYYTELLDDLETADLASPPKAKLVYGGSWSHANGKSMYNYQRSLSSGGSGATLSYDFTGTGLDILGPNNGTAKLEVTVDGKVTEASASTIAAKELYQTYALRGLSDGPHSVKFKVVSGTLVVDAVGVVGAPIP